jgi:hypothetical protein
VKGHAYLWGNNYEGQLCTGDTVDVNFPIKTAPEYPTDDGGNILPGTRWVQVALGAEHTVLLASSGEVYACGSNRVFQLGRPRFFPDTGDGLLSSCLTVKTPNGCPTEYNLRWPHPVRVLGGWTDGTDGKPLQRVVKIAAGSFHSIALTADGTVYAWGDNRMNQLGLGPLVARGNPCCAVPVPFFVDNSLADLEVRCASCGWPQLSRPEILHGSIYLFISYIISSCLSIYFIHHIVLSCVVNVREERRDTLGKKQKNSQLRQDHRYSTLLTVCVLGGGVGGECSRMAGQGECSQGRRRIQRGRGPGTRSWT